VPAGEPIADRVPVEIRAETSGGAATIFDERESAVRSYCRAWPAVFSRARGSWLYDERGTAYLDFFTGASALNYGHNNRRLKQALLDYLTGDNVIHSLDMHTAAKRDFLTAFDELILRPRRLDYRIQFPGPGGANAVEAALKIARKVTGRTEVIAFEGGFHGVTLGALAVTANPLHRGGAGVPLRHAVSLPYDDPRAELPAAGWLGRLAASQGADIRHAAAVIVETVQGEGGIRVARPEWLRGLAAECREHHVPLIVDDVQMGCGRTGPFFSFESAGITPDIVCLSKSIGGYGLPLALTLIRPDLDAWKPGEHNGTFRGVNPSFVTGTAALRAYWADDALQRATAAKGELVSRALAGLAQSGVPGRSRGRGLAWGLAFETAGAAEKVCTAAFERGLLVEAGGTRGEVVKLLPALTASRAELDRGLHILADAVRSVF
jgi:diaminobutyrate-2-oxoglutarate transaminase